MPPPPLPIPFPIPIPVPAPAPHPPHPAVASSRQRATFYGIGIWTPAVVCIAKRATREGEKWRVRRGSGVSAAGAEKAAKYTGKKITQLRDNQKYIST